MKIKDITGKDEKELKSLLSQRRKDLFDLKIENKQNKLKNTRSIFNTRKEIAKIMTLIREKELVAAVEKNNEEVKTVAK